MGISQGTRSKLCSRSLIPISRLYNILLRASFLRRKGIVLISSQLFPFIPMLGCSFFFPWKKDAKVPRAALTHQTSNYSPGWWNGETGCPASSSAPLPALDLSASRDTSQHVALSAFSDPLRPVDLVFKQSVIQEICWKTPSSTKTPGLTGIQLHLLPKCYPHSLHLRSLRKEAQGSGVSPCMPS